MSEVPPGSPIKTFSRLGFRFKFFGLIDMALAVKLAQKLTQSRGAQLRLIDVEIHAVQRFQFQSDVLVDDIGHTAR